MKFCKIPFLISILAILSGCFSVKIQRRGKPANFVKIAELTTNKQFDKALYNKYLNSFCLMNSSESSIYIFKNDKQQNKIGGGGFGKGEFSKLSDIAISPEGNILALDAFQKVVKSFNFEGEWLSDYSIKDFQEPTLLDVDSAGNLAIWDLFRGEIFIVSAFAESDNFGFGKFQIQAPVCLHISEDKIIVREKDKTEIFDSFGNFEQEYDGNVGVDSRSFLYRLEENKIESLKTKEVFFLNLNKKMPDKYIRDDLLICHDGNSATVFQIEYRERQ